MGLERRKRKLLKMKPCVTLSIAPQINRTVGDELKQNAPNYEQHAPSFEIIRSLGMRTHQIAHQFPMSGYFTSISDLTSDKQLSATSAACIGFVHTATGTQITGLNRKYHR